MGKHTLHKTVSHALKLVRATHAIPRQALQEPTEAWHHQIDNYGPARGALSVEGHAEVIVLDDPIGVDIHPGFGTVFSAAPRESIIDQSLAVRDVS